MNANQFAPSAGSYAMRVRTTLRAGCFCDDGCACANGFDTQRCKSYCQPFWDACKQNPQRSFCKPVIVSIDSDIELEDQGALRLP